MLKKTPEEIQNIWAAIPKVHRYNNTNKFLKEAWCLSRYMLDSNLEGFIEFPETLVEKDELEPTDLYLNINEVIEAIQVVENSTHNENQSYPGKMHSVEWVSGSIQPYKLLKEVLTKKKNKYEKNAKLKLSLLIYWNNKGVPLDEEELGIPYLTAIAQQLGFKRVMLVTNIGSYHLSGPTFQ
jgi:hypothetical protein